MKSIKSLLIVSVLALVISGCQTVDDFIGTGPITLSDSVANHYQNKYLKGVGPQYYIVSEDGRYSHYVYCAAGTGQCRFGVVVLESIEKCEKRSRQMCFIFDEGAYVVWKGPVLYGGNSKPRSATRSTNPSSSVKLYDGKTSRGVNLTSLSNLEVCNWAVKSGNPSAEWRTGEEDLPYVQQARIRGLSLEFCKEYLKAGNVRGLSDPTLCSHALGTYGEHPAWVTTGRFARYFHEAQRRGFSPKSCMEVVVQSSRAVNSAEGIDPAKIENRRGLMLTNKKLCAPALDIEKGEAQWSQYKAYLGYTYEAQYRGLNPSTCFQATKAGATGNNAARDVADFTDAELCNLSVTLPDGTPVWSEHADDQEFVKAATARGLKPSNCIASPYLS